MFNEASKKSLYCHAFEQPVVCFMQEIKLQIGRKVKFALTKKKA